MAHVAQMCIPSICRGTRARFPLALNHSVTVIFLCVSVNCHTRKRQKSRCEKHMTIISMTRESKSSCNFKISFRSEVNSRLARTPPPPAPPHFELTCDICQSTTLWFTNYISRKVRNIYFIVCIYMSFCDLSFKLACQLNKINAEIPYIVVKNRCKSLSSEILDISFILHIYMSFCALLFKLARQLNKFNAGMSYIIVIKHYKLISCETLDLYIILWFII